MLLWQSSDGTSSDLVVSLFLPSNLSCMKIIDAKIGRKNCDGASRTNSKTSLCDLPSLITNKRFMVFLKFCLSSHSGAALRVDKTANIN